MILASDIITLARVNDGAKGATGKGVKSNTRYYCLQAPATKPSKPTTNPPDSKWTATEPSYTTGSASYLYTVDLTVYTDNSFLYSEVSLSSSYEAAKAAYAKAVNAETEISKTNEEVALKASKNEVTETLQGYATTEAMNSAITVKANEINSNVEANYTTKADFDSRVSSAETRITQNETNIKSKASQTELSGLTTRVSAAEQNISAANAAIEQKASITEVSGLTTRVSAAEQSIDAANAQIQLKVSKTEFDSLQIGGRNLLQGTHSSAVSYTYPSSSSYTDGWIVTSTVPLNGGTYTLSFWAKSTVNGDRARVHFYNPSNITSVTGSQGQKGTAADGLCDFVLSTTLTKYWVIYTIPESGDSTRDVILPRLYPGHGTGTVTVKWEKLEEGNKATDWSPAPEDAATSVKTTTVTIDTDGMEVSTGGTVNFNTSAFSITPPDGGDQLFSVNASDKNLTAQNGYFNYLTAPNMASRPATTDVITRNIGSGSGYYPSIQAAWDSLPDVCGYAVFNVCSDSPGSASLRNKYVSCLIIQSSPSTSKFNIGTVEFLGLSGTISNVTMSCNGGMYDDACKIIGSNFAFANVTFASSGRGLSIFYGGYACLSNCQISGIGNYAKPQDYAICVHNGFLSCNNTYGVGTAGGIYGISGSLIALDGTCPGPSIVATGATVVGNYTFDGAVIDVPVVEQSSTFTASTWCTWECKSGNLWKKATIDAKVESLQSSYINPGTGSVMHTKRAGWWVIDTGTAIQNALSGKTISRATLMIKRTNGSTGTYKIELAYHSVTACTLNGYTDQASYVITNQLISIGLFDINGDSETIIELPSDLYSKLQDGTIKGFGLLNNGTYNKSVMCDGTCTLNVIYT